MSRKSAADELMREHGQTFAEECGIDLRTGTAAPSWQLLCAALLSSARIRSAIATQAVQGLLRGGLGTAPTSPSPLLRSHPVGARRSRRACSPAREGARCSTSSAA